MQQTLTDYHNVPHRHAGDPTPLRSILPTSWPANYKPYHLHMEPNPMAYTRARLRYNRAYTQTNLDEYNKQHSPTAGMCTHGACTDNQQLESVQHVMLHCPRYEADRQRLQYHLSTLQPKQPLNLSTTLGTLTNPLSTAVKTADRTNYYTRFLSLSSAFITRIQTVRETFNLPAF